MRRGRVRSWGLVLFLLTLSVGGCLPTQGETVMPQPPTAPPPPTALPLLAAVPPPVPHDVEGARKDCMLCHAVGAVEAPPVPANADHQQAVELCSTCHALLPEPAPSTLAPPVITHGLVGREDCLMCHKMGIALAPRIPDNHAGLPADLCQTCHQAGPGVSVPEETPEVGMLPSQVPHPLENRTDCRLCHETGVGEATQFPADHVGRVNEVCTVCHAVSLPVETPVAEAAAPQVPHPLENRTDCRLCHETGVAGATQFPTDHVDRANESCLVCHGVSLPEETPEAEAEVSAPEVPHTLENRSDCRLCHESGVGGAPQFPADHADRANEACLMCHSVSPTAATPGVGVAPPLAPHPVVNHTDCRLCHETGLGGTPLLPADHDSHSNEVCLDCHGLSPSAVARETVRNAPLVPHALSTRADCLRCHDGEADEDHELPDDHAGRPSETCLVCHGVSISQEREEPEDD
jgi:hypothetical protein